MMASPWYAVIPLADAILLLVLARGVARGHRRAMITTIVVQAVGLAGVALGMLAGLLPQVDHTVTLAGLVTDIAMPVLAIILCSRLLGSTPPLPAAGTSGSRAGTP